MTLWCPLINCVFSQSLTGHKNPVECIQFNVSEEQVVAGSQSGSIRVWDLEAAKSKTQFVSLSSEWFHGFTHKHTIRDFVALTAQSCDSECWNSRKRGSV